MSTPTSMIPASPADSPTETRENGARALPFMRDDLGRMVREAWVRWAKTQPHPKPAWLVPYDQLSEADKEADRQIGEAVARWTLVGDAARAAFFSPPATRQRLFPHLSDALVASHVAHIEATVSDTYLLPAGYPAALRDSRASEATKGAEIAEMKRKLEEAQAKLVDAERAGMERAARIAERDTRSDTAKECGYNPVWFKACLEVAEAIRAAMPPAKDEVRG